MDLNKVTFSQVFRLTLYWVVSVFLIWLVAFIVILGVGAIIAGVSQAPSL